MYDFLFPSLVSSLKFPVAKQEAVGNLGPADYDSSERLGTDFGLIRYQFPVCLGGREKVNELSRRWCLGEGVSVCC